MITTPRTVPIARVRGEVERFKDHPALLGWRIGNELNLSSSNPDVWNAVGEVAAIERYRAAILCDPNCMGSYISL